MTAGEVNLSWFVMRSTNDARGSRWRRFWFRIRNRLVPRVFRDY